MNTFNFNKSFSSSVNPGTITWRIHTGILLSLKYLANSRLFLFGDPTKSIDFLLSICFISSKTKSVKDNNSLISSDNGTYPRSIYTSMDFHFF